MHIAFDVHGTLDTDMVIRDFVSLLSYNPDFKIFIISGPPTEQIKKELVELGINIEKVQILSVVDYLKSKNISMYQDKKGTWWCNEESWWASKGMICAEYEIDMIFDDKIRYSHDMPETTKFISWK